MKPSILAKLASLSERLEELNLLLSSADVTSNMDNYRKLTREHSDLDAMVRSTMPGNSASRTCAMPGNAVRSGVKEFRPGRDRGRQARLAQIEVDLRSCCCRRSQRRTQRVPGNPCRHRRR